MGKLHSEDESFAIRGCAMPVHAEMGSRFPEAVYQECMGIELTESRMPFQEQQEPGLTCRGHKLQKKYVADFDCHGKIIVEWKCVDSIGRSEIAQAMNYLKATGFRLALIINFRTKGSSRLSVLCCKSVKLGVIRG